jgi:hypothetical protein
MRNFLRKIIYGKKEEETEVLRRKVSNLSAKLLASEAELAGLRIAKKPERPFIESIIKDPMPADDKEGKEPRKIWVGRWAGFHKDYLGPKILKTIQEVRDELSGIKNDREYDLVLKGTINALWLIYDFGERMINEQLANQQKEISSEEKDLLENLIG